MVISSMALKQAAAKTSTIAGRDPIRSPRRVAVPRGICCNLNDHSFPAWKRTFLTLLLFSAASTNTVAQPLVDHHQHLFHPTDTGLASDTGNVTATELVGYLDA